MTTDLAWISDSLVVAVYCDCKPQLHEELGLELYSTVHRSSLGREDEVPWTECWI